MRRPVRFNCFLRGLDGEEPHRHLRGMSVIANKNPDVMKIFRGKYPELKSAEEYAAVEYTRQICVAVSTAKTIYNIMKRVCPELIGLDPGDDLSLGDSFESAEAESPEKTVYIQEPAEPGRRVINHFGMPLILWSKMRV